MRSGRSFLGVVALLAAARLGADGPPGSPTPAPSAPLTAPPLVAVNPPAPAPQLARGPEAIKLFGRLDDDRSTVFIASGTPDARVTVRCPDTFRTLEIWTYLEHPTLGKNARIVFYPESPTGTYRYWTVLEGEGVLLAPAAKGGLAAVEAAPGACAALSGCVSQTVPAANATAIPHEVIDRMVPLSMRHPTILRSTTSRSDISRQDGRANLGRTLVDSISAA